jgi:two-component sensor histidine kinase
MRIPRHPSGRLDALATWPRTVLLRRRGAAGSHDWCDGRHNRTLSRSGSLEEFRTSFRDRLQALARVNGLLSRLNEGDRITFNELIGAELAAHGLTEGSAREGRVRLNGPENVRLRSSTVQTLALALHELATNALKHGALSRPDGLLSIHWSVETIANEEPRLKVDWQEWRSNRARTGTHS